MGRIWAVVALLGLALTGCGGGNAFACDDDAQCDPATGGRCEITGFCSFPDPECLSGYRYGTHAGGGLASSCTDPSPGTGTGSVGSTGPDTSTTDPTTTTTTSGDTTGAVACPDWWDCAWAYRRSIVVAGDVADAPLQDFPVPVVIADVSDALRFGPDGLDIRVVADDGTLLDVDVDTWDPATGVGLVWVAMPQLSPGVEASAHLYYGRPDAPPLDTGAATWDDGFAAVWHLGGTDDATVHGNHAEDQGSTVVPGVFGGARMFDADDQRLLVSPSRSLTDLATSGVTLSAIIQPLSIGVTSGGRVFDNADSQAATLGLQVMPAASTTGLEFNRGGATTEGQWITGETLPYGQWFHLAVTFVDGEDPRAFVDGQPLVWQTATPPVGQPGSDAAAPVGIGGAPYDATHTFDGAIDELRVTRGVRSDAWLLAEVRVAAGGAVTVGDEESAPAP
jgi:hypothetical protein